MLRIGIVSCRCCVREILQSPSPAATSHCPQVSLSRTRWHPNALAIAVATRGPQNPTVP
jgi:hypothetical protein